MGRRRLPTLLERGVCVNGHAIASLEDVRVGRRPDGTETHACRACERDRDERQRTGQPRPSRAIPPVDEQLELARARPCPRCGTAPTRVYAYRYAIGRRRLAYCPACKRAYALDGFGR